MNIKKQNREELDTQLEAVIRCLVAASGLRDLQDMHEDVPANELQALGCEVELLENALDLLGEHLEHRRSALQTLQGDNPRTDRDEVVDA